MTDAVTTFSLDIEPPLPLAKAHEVDLLRKAVVGNPSSITLRGRLASLHFIQDRFDEAIALYRQLWDEAPSALWATMRVKDGRIVDTEVFVTGLDNGCHQIDLIGNTLVVVDTYRQRILEVAPDATVKEFQPFPFDREQRGPADYVHFNSVLACGDRRLLLLHNDFGRTGRASEIALLDASWTVVDCRPMEGTGCHNLALLEDGSVLSCGSVEGALISTAGIRAKVSNLMTRGLAVGQDVIAVGGSTFSEREHRDSEPGVLHLLDRQFRLLSSLPLPAPPTEIRRLDGNDLSLSRHVAARGLTLGWPQVTCSST
jgi:hypothetical protein